MSLASPYASLYIKYGQKHGVDPKLLEAQGFQESGWKPDAQSKAGAIGIAQLMPDTAKSLGLSVEDAKDPEKAIEAQAKYMKLLLNQFGGKTEAALAAYNWGPGNVSKHLKKHGGILSRKDMPEETAKYLSKLYDGSGGTVKDYKPLGMGNVPIQKEGLGQLDAIEKAQRDADIEAGKRGTLSNIGMAVRGAYALASPTVSYTRNELNFDDIHMGEPPKESPDSLVPYIVNELGLSGAEADFIANNASSREEAKRLSDYQHTRDEEIAELFRHGSVLGIGATIAASVASPETALTGGLGRLVTAGKTVQAVEAAQAASKAAGYLKGAAAGAAGGVAYGYGLYTQSAQEFHPLQDAAFGSIVGAVAHHLGRKSPVAAREFKDSLPNPKQTPIPKEDMATLLHPYQQSEEAQVIRENSAKAYGPRYDVIGRLKKADSPAFIQEVNKISRDPTSLYQGMTIEEDMTIRSNRVHQAIGESSRAAEAHGLDVTNKESFGQFSKSVSDAIMDDAAYEAAHPGVKAAADVVRKHLMQYDNELHALGITDKKFADRNYYPSRLSPHKIDLMASKLGGVKKLEELVAKAYRESKLSMKYLKQTRAEYEEYLKGFKKKYPEGEPVDMRTWIHEKSGGYAETLINSNLNDLTEHLNYGLDKNGKSIVGGKSSHLQHAEKFDRGYRISLPDGSSFAIEDLREFNLHNDLLSYHRSMSPDMAAVKVTGMLPEEFVANAYKVLADKQGDINHHAIKKLKDEFVYALNNALHRNSGERNLFSNLADIYGRLNYSRVGGWFAANQMGEYMQALAIDGGKTMMKMFKHMGVDHLVDAARNGDPAYQKAFKIIERVWGGADQTAWSRYNMSHLANPLYGGANLKSWQKVLNGVDKAASGAARMMARYSGFEAVQAASIQMGQLGVIDAIAEAAKGSKNAILKSHFTGKRLAGYGVTHNELKELFRELKTYKGDNFDAVSRLRPKNQQVLQRLARRMLDEIIQPNSKNALPKALTESPIMRLSFQFMSFPIAAWSHQALRAFRYADRVTALKMLGGFIGNALTYMARMYAQSYTRREREREEFVEKYLSPEAISMAGITRLSAMSIVPNVLNTPLSVMGIEIPGISSARTTGNSASIFGGSLPQDAGTILSLLQSTRRALMEDKDFTDADVDKLGRLIVPNHILTQLMWKTLRDAPDEFN